MSQIVKEFNSAGGVSKKVTDILQWFLNEHMATLPTDDPTFLTEKIFPYAGSFFLLSHQPIYQDLNLQERLIDIRSKVFHDPLVVQAAVRNFVVAPTSLIMDSYTLFLGAYKILIGYNKGEFIRWIPSLKDGGFSWKSEKTTASLQDLNQAMLTLLKPTSLLHCLVLLCINFLFSSYSCVGWLAKFILLQLPPSHQEVTKPIIGEPLNYNLDATFTPGYKIFPTLLLGETRGTHGLFNFLT